MLMVFFRASEQGIAHGGDCCVAGFSPPSISQLGHSRRTKAGSGFPGCPLRPRKGTKQLTCRQVRLVPILLKKSLMISGSSDSVAVMRFAVEAGDDGAARSRSRAAVLFILS